MTIKATTKINKEMKFNVLIKMTDFVREQRVYMHISISLICNTKISSHFSQKTAADVKTSAAQEVKKHESAPLLLSISAELLLHGSQKGQPTHH